MVRYVSLDCARRYLALLLVQVYGETDVEVVERDVRRLAGGFLGLAVGAGLSYFIAVSKSKLHIYT